MTTGDNSHTNYHCRKLLAVSTGARDMLREAAKALRLKGDKGHADMCEMHADELSKFVPS